jgi:hypothetical protein
LCFVYRPLKRDAVAGYELLHGFQAHISIIRHVAMNCDSSILASVCHDDNEVKLWAFNQGLHPLTNTAEEHTIQSTS